MKTLPLTLSVSVLCGSLLVARGVDIFTIDPSRSQITLSGTIKAPTYFISTPVTAQGPGSLVSSFSGSIIVERYGSMIEFLGLSLADARTNGVWSPAPGGVAGTAPADYAGHAQQFFPPFTADLAFRNIRVSFSSGGVAINTSGQFSPASLVFAFDPNSASIVDYLPSIVAGGSATLSGTLQNASTGTGILQFANGTQELVVPVDASYTVTSGDLLGTSFRMVGRLTATAPVKPRIESLRVQGGAAVLSATNALAGATLSASTDLLHWTSTGTSVSNSAGLAFFVVPATNYFLFFRVKN